MSRVYFHTQAGKAELNGSERAWFGRLAGGPALQAWGVLDFGTERLAQIIAMIPEPPAGTYGSNYLHTGLRTVQQAETRPAYDPAPFWQLQRSLSTRLDLAQGVFRVAGRDIPMFDVVLNTALVAGSDLIRLAAKIHGTCEIHGWIDGPDRAWAADLIREGLDRGLYREGLDVVGFPGGPARWMPQGWDDVIALLRADTDGPVVMSESSGTSFPNAAAAGWPDPDDDEDRPRRPGEFDPDWRVSWDDVDEAEQWQLAVAGLRRDRAKQRIGPDTLADQWYGLGLSAYDLLAPDRDDRVRDARRDTAPAGEAAP